MRLALDAKIHGLLDSHAAYYTARATYSDL